MQQRALAVGTKLVGRQTRVRVGPLANTNAARCRRILCAWGEKGRGGGNCASEEVLPIITRHVHFLACDPTTRSRLRRATELVAYVRSTCAQLVFYAQQPVVLGQPLHGHGSAGAELPCPQAHREIRDERILCFCWHAGHLGNTAPTSASSHGHASRHDVVRTTTPQFSFFTCWHVAITSVTVPTCSGRKVMALIKFAASHSRTRLELEFWHAAYAVSHMRSQQGP